ncbi:MAG TPA: GDP-mannose 4,6-dehydratase [Gemmatimonadaceae bacterium]|nr:GDP-mannose 4,6-dehydratase [Gemmatimonadaceae bacterium]
MRALVTGAAGFVGSWLVRALAERGDEVHALSLDAPVPGALGTPAVPGAAAAAVRWHVGDVRDRAALGALLTGARPDVIFHLAGVSSVRAAASDPVLACETNVIATVGLLEAAARLRDARVADPVILVVGSSEQYGAHPPDEQPLTEDAEQRPLTLYAATKCAQEVFARQAVRRDGLRVVCTRSFNHTGAGQSEHFLLPALVRRALALPPAGGELHLGNLTPVRDVSHVSDVVRAYILLAERGTPGDAYNVCSGHGHSVREMAEAVLRRVGVEAGLLEDPALVRPVDVPMLVGSAARLRTITGWEPRRTLDDCIDDLIHAATR